MNYVKRQYDLEHSTRETVGPNLELRISYTEQNRRLRFIHKKQGLVLFEDYRKQALYYAPSCTVFFLFNKFHKICKTSINSCPHPYTFFLKDKYKKIVLKSIL